MLNFMLTCLQPSPLPSLFCWFLHGQFCREGRNSINSAAFADYINHIPLAFSILSSSYSDDQHKFCFLITQILLQLSLLSHPLPRTVTGTYSVKYFAKTLQVLLGYLKLCITFTWTSDEESNRTKENQFETFFQDFDVKNICTINCFKWTSYAFIITIQGSNYFANKRTKW